MWRRGDRERFIGSYDPEYEMPDPDRRRRGPYESEAYRRNFGDNRYAYRWNPDRIEERYRAERYRDDRERFGRPYEDEARWRIQGRERYGGWPRGLYYEGEGWREPRRDWDYDRPPRSFDDRYEPPYGFERYENWDDDRYDRDRGWPDYDRDRWRRDRY